MKTLLSAFAVAFVIVFSPLTVDAAQVTWGAAQSNGVGTAEGIRLDIGDLVRVGWFDFSNDLATNNAMIAANAANVNFLNSHFIEFDASAIGANSPNGGGDNTGYWLDNPNASTDALSLQNKQIYYWVFDATTIGGASQHGVFTDPSPTWIFPADAAIPNTTVTDLSEVNQDSTGIIIGTFGNGLSADGASMLYNLAVIPEPSTFALFGVGAIGLAWLRRKRA